MFLYSDCWQWATPEVCKIDLIYSPNNPRFLSISLCTLSSTNVLDKTRKYLSSSKKDIGQLSNYCLPCAPQS